MGEKNCVTFIWRISNFIDSEVVQSPEFHVDSLRESGWILRLNIVHSNFILPTLTPYTANVTVDLENKYCKDLGPLRLDYEVAILPVTSFNPDTCAEKNVKFTPGTNRRTSEYSLLEIFSKQYISRDDVLTIQCKLWKLDEGEALTPLFYQACTRLGIRKFSLTWPLKFSSLQEGKTQTKKFNFGPDQPILKVETLISDFKRKHNYFSGSYMKKYRNLEFLIEQQNDNFEELELSCRTSVLDKWGKFSNSKQSSQNLKSGEILKVDRLICINFVKLNKKTYIKNNELKILFDFTFYEDDYSVLESVSESTPNSQGKSQKNTVDAYTSTEIERFPTSKSLKDDLYDMYLTNSCSDVVLEAESCAFPCHKCILSARSPVLRSLLSESTAYTTELKASVLSSFLQFIYTGDIGTALDFQLALELYEAANKYQVLSLKNVCSEFLEVNMTEQNVCEILIVSSKQQDIAMKKMAETFLLKKHADIISSDKWRNLVKNEASHIVETMHRICLEKAVASTFLFKPSLDNATSFDTETSTLAHKSNFWLIYQSSLFSDFQLCTDGKTYDVHKNILWARSPVFKAMLSSTLKESSKNFLDIPDVDDPTMERLINFMYSGNLEVKELAEIPKLYCAADIYQIVSLKNWCSESLVQKLSIENVCEILILSHQCGDEKFKDEVLNFLTKNDESVILSVKWKKLMKSDPLLASEAMYQIYAKKTNANTANTDADPEKSPQHPESNQQFVISDAVAIMQVDFISLYDQKFLSDFKLCTDDRSFEVHKNILCARSPVFNAMLLSNLEEATTNTLVIPDINGQTVDQMLRYMYTGTLEDTENIDLCKLYYAADKYQINSLRDWCSHLLSENISVENVCEILLLANRHGDINLETAVQSFLIKNSKEVFNSDSWKTFMLNEPQVSCQTMLTIY